MNTHTQDFLNTRTIEELKEIAKEADRIKNEKMGEEKKKIKADIIDLLKELKNYDDSGVYFPVEIEICSEEPRYGDFVEDDVYFNINDLITMVDSL